MWVTKIITYWIENPNLKLQSRAAAVSCHHQSTPLLTFSGMAGKENKNSIFNRAKGKKLKSSKNDECQQWSDLPSELLYLILMQLTFADFFAFGGVCKSWRVLASTHRQQFMERQSPLVVVFPKRAKRNFLLSNVFERSNFKTVLPNFSGRTCYGVSCGYLVLKDNRKVAGLWLLNPVTRQEYRLSYSHFLARRVIVASLTMDSSDIAIVALSGCSYRTRLSESHLGNLEIYRPRDEHPSVLHYLFGTHFILDLAIFQGKVFALSNQGGVGLLTLRPHPMLTMLEVKSLLLPAHPYEIFRKPPLQRFVTSDQQLFLVYVYSLRRFKVYMLDFVRMEWLEVDSLGDKALFVSYPMSVEFNDARRWGEQNNCIYYLESNNTYTCNCYSLDGIHLKSFQIDGDVKLSKSAWPLWYFPHLAYGTSSLSEEFFG